MKTNFDLNFLDNWLAKKVNGRYYHAGEQARNLAILLSNRLGENCISNDGNDSLFCNVDCNKYNITK